MTGRNEPCLCGSGKKYKKCCLRLHEEVQTRQRSLDQAVKGLFAWLETNRRLPEEEELLAFDWVWDNVDDVLGLELMWRTAIRQDEDGVTDMAAYLAAHPDLKGPSRDVIEAQQAGWFSLWQVEAVENGAIVHLRDPITGTLRRCHDLNLAQSVEVGLTALAFTFEYDGNGWMSAVYPQALDAAEAELTLEGVRAAVYGTLALADDAVVTPDQLRGPEVTRALIESFLTVMEAFAMDEDELEAVLNDAIDEGDGLPDP